MNALYPRATVIILDQVNRVLVIKYHPSDEWQLPGHWLDGETDPAQVLITNVSRRLGLNIRNVQFRGFIPEIRHSTAYSSPTLKATPTQH